ncbi:MAG: cell division protein FtsX [Acetobacteraceae bacterium]|nr:cell division protein FtsX [Acetobacteraceae bacterium]
MARHSERRRARLLRPRGFDELGLRRASSDRLLPFLVAAMAFLAALALGGAVAASSLASHWREGAGAAATVIVPHPTQPAPDAGSSRMQRVLALLRGTEGILSARALSDEEVADLLRPWLGADIERLSLALPGVAVVQIRPGAGELGSLAARLETAAPGTLVESHSLWLRRLSALARSVQACAAVATAVVASVAAAVVSVATRAGLSARRETIESVHGLGATDGYIATRFAKRAARLAMLGGAAGAVAAMPVLLGLANLAAPFSHEWGGGSGGGGPLAAIPFSLWLALIALPGAAGLLGLLTAEATVLRWLRRLP